jgi:hypothetical protein
MRRIYSTSYEPPKRSKNPSIPHPHGKQIRLAAILAWIRWISLFILIGVGGAALIYKDEYLFAALVLIGVHIVSMILFFIFAGGLRCRVCSNPVLLSSRAHKSPHARPFAGLSFPLQVAKDALFTKHFTCMYCGGKIRLSKRRDQ